MRGGIEPNIHFDQDERSGGGTAETVSPNSEIPDPEVPANPEVISTAEKNRQRLAEFYKEKNKLSGQDIQETLDNRGKALPLHLLHGNDEQPVGLWFINFIKKDPEGAKLFLTDNIEKKQGQKDDYIDTLWRDILGTIESPNILESKCSFVGEQLAKQNLGRVSTLHGHESFGEKWLDNVGFNDVFMKYRKQNGEIYEDNIRPEFRNWPRNFNWKWLQDYVFQKYLEKSSSDAIIEDFELFKNIHNRRQKKIPNILTDLLNGSIKYDDIPQDKQAEVGGSLLTLKGQLWNHFFEHMNGKGIISSYGFTYRHTESGSWLLWDLVRNKSQEDLHETVDSIELNDPRKTMITLADKKIAKGLRLAEVAGKAYARIFAFLGGESAYWVDGDAAKIKPAPIDQCQNYADKNKLLEDYIRTNGILEKIEIPSGTLCMPENCSKLFDEHSYDIFMAVNYGWVKGPEEVRELVLKPGRNENLDWWISYEENIPFSASHNLP